MIIFSFAFSSFAVELSLSVGVYPAVGTEVGSLGSAAKKSLPDYPGKIFALKVVRYETEAQSPDCSPLKTSKAGNFYAFLTAPGFAGRSEMGCLSTI
jgi:hypothetical protein